MKLAQFYPEDVLWVTEDVAKAKSDGDIDRLMRLYRDMIYYNDHHLGALIEKLKELKLYEDTFLIVTGDHGEAFGEHGFNSHGREPYDELLRVPLIMKFPFSQFHGEVSSIVQHIDIVPTLLDFLKIPTGNHRSMQGRSLLPLLRDQRPVNEYAFAEHWPGRQYVSHIAFRTEDYKLIAVRRQEVTLRQWFRDPRKLWPSPWFVYKPLSLYDLRKDPGEKINIIKEEEDRTRRFHSRVKSILRDNKNVARAFKKKGVAGGLETRDVKKVDDEVSKQLKALGYFD
jgi:arylsulfatase A-like enzyme